MDTSTLPLCAAADPAPALGHSRSSITSFSIAPA
jgi:hypothetical protein